MHESRLFPVEQGHQAITGARELPADEADEADEADSWLPQPLAGEAALDWLRILVREFSSPRQPLWCPAPQRSKAPEKAQVFRVRPGQSMHVVGASPLAAELRRLLMAGAEPGWELHPVPARRTPLHTLAAPLRHLSGNGRFYNLLDRSGFAYVEEVAATPDECLMDLRNGGPGFVAALRQAISELTPRATSRADGTAPDDGEPDTEPLLALSSTTLRALKVMAAWAVSEQGARTAGDLIAAVSITRELPPDVAAAWDHIRRLELREAVGLEHCLRRH